jgi:probable HAF family extracellular repeat protein
VRATFSHWSIGGAAVALLLAVACRGDLVTRPAAAPLAPGAPARTLVGSVGTPIFPTAAPGEPQHGGDARGLNRRGQVTGAGLGIGVLDDHYKPYRWTPGSAAARLVGCCDFQWGNDINDAGTVVGMVWTNEHRGSAFVATGTSMTALPLLPGADPHNLSGAMAINNRGQIVGISPVSGGGLHAVLWSPSLVPRDIGTLGGLVSSAVDINDAGQVIGYSDLPGDATSHAFLWSEEGLVDLNILITPRLISVVEINASGQIIGTYITNVGESHAFLYTPGSVLRDLGTLGGDESAPTGLNDRGDVVGISMLPDRSTHAFLWTAADGMEDITALTGMPEVGRLNDQLQTLTGFDAPSFSPNFRLTQPQLVQLQVTRPLVARFTVNCVDRAHPHQCQFDASTSTSDAGIVSYAWDWGNGRHETKKTPLVRNTWPKGGSYLVTLTVTDTKGQTNSIARTVFVP